MSHTSMDVKNIIKTTVEGRSVVLECNKGNRITCPKVLLEVLGGDLKSIHFPTLTESKDKL